MVRTKRIHTPAPAAVHSQNTTAPPLLQIFFSEQDEPESSGYQGNSQGVQGHLPQMRCFQIGVLEPLAGWQKIVEEFVNRPGSTPQEFGIWERLCGGVAQGVCKHITVIKFRCI